MAGGWRHDQTTPDTNRPEPTTPTMARRAMNRRYFESLYAQARETGAAPIPIDDTVAVAKRRYRPAPGTAATKIGGMPRSMTPEQERRVYDEITATRPGRGARKVVYCRLADELKVGVSTLQRIVTEHRRMELARIVAKFHAKPQQVPISPTQEISDVR